MDVGHRYHHPTSFNDLIARSGAREMWDKVNDLTGKGKNNFSTKCVSTNFTAEQLNQHYEKQSTDLNYVTSCFKQTAEPFSPSLVFSDLSVFNMINKLKNTSPGADGLPFWLLKLVAFCIVKPLAHVYNLSLSCAK